MKDCMDEDDREYCSPASVSISDTSASSWLFHAHFRPFDINSRTRTTGSLQYRGTVEDSEVVGFATAIKPSTNLESTITRQFALLAET